MHTSLQILTIFIICLSAINLVRMMFYMVGSDIYAVLEHLNRKPGKRKPFVFPTFTVVIPAHNEGISVLTSVRSVLASNYPKNKLNVVVIDDGSKDNTFQILQDYKSEHDIQNLNLVHQENAGKARALNNGFQNYATGELVMCLDADSYLEPNSLREAAWYFDKDKRTVALSANVRIINTGSLMNLIQRYEYLICYQMKRAQTVFNVEYIIGGIGSTFRRSVLEEVGYYDTNTITEDIDLTMKFIKLGNKENRVAYGAKVIAYTQSVLNVKDLINQRYRWKYGRTQTFIKNAGLFFNSGSQYSKLLTWVFLPYAIFCDAVFFLEPLFVTYIVGESLYYHDWMTLVTAISVVSAYMMLNVLSEDTLAFRDKWKLVLLAPTMYVFFYLLSYVEYVALIKSIFNSRQIYRSITDADAEVCHWEHVERSGI